MADDAATILTGAALIKDQVRRLPDAPGVYRMFGEDGEALGVVAMAEALQKARLWVTFNGRCFDVPVLQRHFSDLPIPPVHLDLRFLCHRVGLRGGLKTVEQTIGIPRPPHLRGVGGCEAAVLWRTWIATDELEALRFLVEYNLYDAFQLRALADAAYNRAVEQLAFDGERIPVWERGDLLYDVSRLVLALDPVARGPARLDG